LPRHIRRFPETGEIDAEQFGLLAQPSCADPVNQAAARKKFLGWTATAFAARLYLGFPDAVDDRDVQKTTKVEAVWTIK